MKTVLDKIAGFFIKKVDINEMAEDVKGSLKNYRKYRITKKGIATIIIAILAFLLYTGSIDVDTFIELFKEVE